MEEKERKQKRLLMRAEHRGIKEMDIILGGYVRKNLHRFSDEQMAQIEAFMTENDQLLYQMILGNEIVPGEFSDLVKDIREHIEAN